MAQMCASKTKSCLSATLRLWGCLFPICSYRRLLKQAGMIPSMSGKGNCYDNAMVETVFTTIESELVRRTSFLTRRQAEKAIGRYIDGFYNPTRRHSALGYISPIKFEAAVADTD